MAAEPTLPSSLVTAFKDQYEVLREIGRGGSATVYLARDLKHDRSVAIKVLNADVRKTSGERFLREIRMSAKMQHPHILPIYDSGIADGHLYFVMPFVEGGSLRDRLRANTALPIDESLRIARQIGVALAHAHLHGIVHRDVKPENIMFYHGTACLADFGIARPLEELEEGITGHGTLVGTPGYMSPEQFLTVFDGRSDIYSLSCVLYEMIAGSKLFEGTTPQEIVARRGHLLTARRNLGPELPDYLEVLLDRGLARAPHNRFNDANEFIAAVDEALFRAERPARDSGPRRAMREIRRRKVEFGIGVVTVALLGVALWPRLRESAARSRLVQQSTPVSTSPNPLAAGKSALAAWDIPRALTELAAAVDSAPANPAPRVWLAESYLLARHAAREDFRVAAGPLETFRSRMHGRDSLFAEAAVAIASGRPADACRAYATQLHRDTVDVLAWYGIGDCNALDTTVVRDRRSPSGWRFVSSYDAAARAYLRAIELAPGAHAVVPLSLLARLLPGSAALIRLGRSQPPDSLLFAAYPALIADSVAFIPSPLDMFSSVSPQTISPTYRLALERNQKILLAFATEWVGSAPESADAWEALALTHELRGELAGDGAGAALAAEVADMLSGLAALTGRVQLMATLRATATAARFANIGVAPPLAAAEARLFARAAPGVCDDSLTALRKDFERLLESYSQPARRGYIRQLAIWQSAELSFPCLRGAALADLTPTLPLHRAQLAFVGGDIARTRVILDSISAVRSGFRPGDIALDHTVQEAWLRAASGDTAAAERQLDLVLDALPTLSALTAVREGAQSAAVGRAMVLRADLAVARRDSLTARRWARNVVDLWTHADPSLGPTVERMKTVAK